MRRREEKHIKEQKQRGIEAGRWVVDTTLSSLSHSSCWTSSSISVYWSACVPSLRFIIARSLSLSYSTGCNTLLSMNLWLSLFLGVTPPPTLGSSSASGKHCMPLNHIYWAKAACECFLIVAANISGGASLSLSFSASQLMWFGWAACLHSILPLLITKTLPGWLTTVLSDLTVGLADWLAGWRINNHCIYELQVGFLAHVVPVRMLSFMSILCLTDWMLVVWEDNYLDDSAVNLQHTHINGHRSLEGISTYDSAHSSAHYEVTALLYITTNFNSNGLVCTNFTFIWWVNIHQ